MAILRSLLAVVVVFSSGNQQHTRRSGPVRVVTAFTLTTTAATTPGVGRGTRGPSVSSSSVATTTTTLPATTEKETATGSSPDAANPNHRNEPHRCATTDATTTETTTTTTIRTIPWLIVGGGIHGVHVAARLRQQQQQQQQQQTTTHGEEDHPNEEVCLIIDAQPELLSTWKTRTAATGMDYLRSSAGYHLDIQEQSLRAHYYSAAAPAAAPNTNRNLSKKRKRKQNKTRNNNSSSSSRQNPKTPVFANDYERPTLAVFNTHCAAVIAKYQLQALHVRGTVTAIAAAVAATNETETTVFEVEVAVPAPAANNDDDDAVAGAPGPHRHTRITYQAHNIVLAVGNAAISYENTKKANNPPSKNPWIDADDIQHGYVRHIFDDEETTTTTKQQQRPENHPMNEEHAIAVVGNGISAVHKVLALVKQRRQQRQKNKNKNTTNKNNNSIYLISKNPDFILQQFDTHQDWMMDRAAAQRSLQHGGAGWPRRVQQFQALGQDKSEATKTTTSEKKNKNKQERYAQRRQIIQHERRPGTITAALYHGTAGLASAIHTGEIRYYNTTTILNKRYIDDQSDDPDTEDDHNNSRSSTTISTKKKKKKRRLELTLASPSSSYAPDGITTTTTTSTIIVDEVILATGFGKQLPGGKLITDLIDKYAPPASGITATSTNGDDDSPFVLEVSEYCGYPIVDQNLCWTKLKDTNGHQSDADRGTSTGGNIYVTGALAELELGPSARNIAGARLAAERILQHASLDTKLNELK